MANKILSYNIFKRLKDEDLERLLRKLHVRMDSNRDGFVDREELYVWCLISMFNIQDSVQIFGNIILMSFF